MNRLLEIKKEIGNLSKNAENPFFKSAYLDLTELLNHIEPILWKHGLILLQPIKDDKVGSQIIDPESEKVICEAFISLPEIKDPQKMGSAITYFRRYTLKSLLAIAEVDDDGNKASGNQTKGGKRKFTIGSEAWKKAVSQKLQLDKIEEYYEITPEVEKEYLKAIENVK